MNHEIRQFTKRLREARLAKNLTQRELSELTGVPQAQISRIEGNEIDLRLSTFVALANALDLEQVLVPRKAVPAVKAIARQVATPGLESSGDEPRPAYTLEEDDDA